MLSAVQRLEVEEGGALPAKGGAAMHHLVPAGSPTMVGGRRDVTPTPPRQTYGVGPSLVGVGCGRPITSSASVGVGRERPGR